jgi:hypothetical protein
MRRQQTEAHESEGANKPATRNLKFPASARDESAFTQDQSFRIFLNAFKRLLLIMEISWHLFYPLVLGLDLKSTVKLSKYTGRVVSLFCHILRSHKPWLTSWYTLERPSMSFIMFWVLTYGGGQVIEYWIILQWKSNLKIIGEFGCTPCILLERPWLRRFNEHDLEIK